MPDQPDLVDSARIDEAPMEQGTPRNAQRPTDPLTRDPIIDQKMGWLGKAFGYGEEKKGNLAALGFCFAALLLTVCVFTPMFTTATSVTDVTGQLITPLVGFIAGVWGYITGQKSDR